MSSDEKKSKKAKQEEALDALFPVAESVPESTEPLVASSVSTPDGQPASSAAEESTSTQKTGEDSPAPEVSEPPKSGSSGDPVESAEKTDVTNSITQYTEVRMPTLSVVLRAFADEIGPACELANKHLNDGNPGVNLHGTRLMNRTRTFQNECRSFAKFLDDNGIVVTPNG